MYKRQALWETQDPAPLSLISIIDEKNREDIFAIHIPAALSLLSYNRLDGAVQGINDIQAEYEQKYGPGDYVPPVIVSYWAFRAMFGPGLLMPLIAALGLYLVLRGRLQDTPWFLRLLPFAIPLPYLANSAGWILTEVGRQPWIVFGLMRTEQAVSPGVPAGMVLFSLLTLTVLYGLLMGADAYLLAKFARRGPDADEEAAESGAAY